MPAIMFGSTSGTSTSCVPGSSSNSNGLLTCTACIDGFAFAYSSSAACMLRLDCSMVAVVDIGFYRDWFSTRGVLSDDYTPSRHAKRDLLWLRTYLRPH